MRILIALVVSAAMLGAAHAREGSFSAVPANIADAPPDEFAHVQRHDTVHAYRWKVSFPGGYIWVANLGGGRYWPEAGYSTKSRVLRMFREDGFDR